MARVLVSWIGKTDLQASQGEDHAGLGPLGQAFAKRTFDEIVLLSNYTKPQNDAYVHWAKPQTKAKLTLHHVELKDPTEFLAIVRIVDPVLAVLAERARNANETLELTFHLSPGTPAMSTIWMLLAKTRYPAELIQSSREQGVRTTAVPFDIVAEFIELVPKLTAQPDAALTARSGGAQRDAEQFGDIVYRCQAMKDVVVRAKKAAARSVSVLIQGETGTGKELFARAIYQASPRASRPFIVVNCGAIPRELVESQLFGHTKGSFTGATSDRHGAFRDADGGTLFLDEIGELPLDAQVKLLRAVQDQKVTPVGASRPYQADVRLIAATNRNLAAEVQAGRFREDLFYRLAVAVLQLPPLRERSGDLGPLIDALLNQANAAGKKDEPGFTPKQLSTKARALLMSQRWPGNVRELEHTLMRATVWADEPTISEAELRAALFQGAVPSAAAASTIPLTIESGFALRSALDELSRQYIELALKQTNHNKNDAAKLLGLNSHQVLTARMNKLGIEQKWG